MNTFHKLEVVLPDVDSNSKSQLLHHQCGGELVIGDDGTIRCEKCETQKPALEWCIADDTHLSENFSNGQQLDNIVIMDLAGQLTAIAGRQWLLNLLANLKNDDETPDLPSQPTPSTPQNSLPVKKPLIPKLPQFPTPSTPSTPSTPYVSLVWKYTKLAFKRIYRALCLIATGKASKDK